MSTLVEGTVHVWWAELAPAPAGWRDLLDPAELTRLAGYVREDDRNRFLTGAAIVRHALGQQLGRPPSAVALDRGCPDCPRPHGKVRLAGTGPDPAGAGWEISVSHSGRWIGVAVHRGGPVGLDVERVDDRLDPTELGRITLAPAEREALAALDPNRRTAGFTRLWCRKEAVVKLTGDGLRADLTEVVVTGPDAPAALVGWARRPELVGRLTLRDLTARAGHAACLAVLTGHPVRVVERPATELFDRPL